MFSGIAIDVPASLNSFKDGDSPTAVEEMAKLRVEALDILDEAATKAAVLSRHKKLHTAVTTQGTYTAGELMELVDRVASDNMVLYTYLVIATQLEVFEGHAFEDAADLIDAVRHHRVVVK